MLSVTYADIISNDSQTAQMEGQPSVGSTAISCETYQTLGL